MKRLNSPLSDAQVTSSGLVILLGLASFFPYLYAWYLGDLRVHMPGFLVAFVAAFILYGVATILVLKMNARSARRLIIAIFGIALILNALLVFTSPSLSDDMYRYVWDGRVQAQGISPYSYAPDDLELFGLRDRSVWRFINRKSSSLYIHRRPNYCLPSPGEYARTACAGSRRSRLEWLCWQARF